MIYGVKTIYTYSVGERDLRFYEESILMVNANSFDEAFQKAECYSQKLPTEHINPEGETVKTIRVDHLECFHAFDPEEDVQEVFSTFSVNRTSLSEEEYYRAITEDCDEETLRPLLNKEFN